MGLQWYDMEASCKFHVFKTCPSVVLPKTVTEMLCACQRFQVSSVRFWSTAVKHGYGINQTRYGPTGTNSETSTKSNISWGSAHHFKPSIPLWSQGVTVPKFHHKLNNLLNKRSMHSYDLRFCEIDIPRTNRSQNSFIMHGLINYTKKRYTTILAIIIRDNVSVCK